MEMLLNSKYKNIIKILKRGGVGVMSTDTLYGLVGSAFSRVAVNRIYKLKNRDEKKALIVLIASVKDLEKFGIRHTNKLEFVGMSKKVWPGKVSVILDCPNKNFKYIHQGLNSIAFRLPKNKKLIEILKHTGPLVAPSANPEGLVPAKNIKEAKGYFGDSVDFYMGGGTLKGESSTLIKINKKGEIEVLRGTPGSEFSQCAKRV